MADEPQNPQINISNIPVKGGIGAVLVIIVLVAALLVELPPLRWPTLLGVLGGVLLAAVLILWRRSRSR